jgi:dTMP kinase
MDALTEALLVFGARRDHLRTVILPALARGDTVLSDRFTDATIAYQGHGHGVDGTLLATLEAAVQQGLGPDLTLWFDVPLELAADRLANARDLDRFERLDRAFFQRVREGYQARMQAEPRRIARIDAALPTEQVRAAVLDVLRERGW